MARKTTKRDAVAEQRAEWAVYKRQRRKQRKEVQIGLTVNRKFIAMLDAEVKRRNDAETEDWHHHTRGHVIRGAVDFICSEEGQAVHKRLVDERAQRMEALTAKWRASPAAEKQSNVTG